MPSGAWGPASETVGGPSEPPSIGRACCCREGMPVDMTGSLTPAGEFTTNTNHHSPEQRGESVDGIRCEEKKESAPPRQVGGGHHRAGFHSRIMRQQLHQLDRDDESSGRHGNNSGRRRHGNNSGRRRDGNDGGPRQSAERRSDRRHERSAHRHQRHAVPEHQGSGPYLPGVHQRQGRHQGSATAGHLLRRQERRQRGGQLRSQGRREQGRRRTSVRSPSTSAAASRSTRRTRSPGSARAARSSRRRTRRRSRSRWDSSAGSPPPPR